MVLSTRLLGSILVVMIAMVNAPPAGAFAGTAGSWQMVAAPPTPRIDVETVTGPDGRIYAIGGRLEVGGGLIGVVEAYTPDTDSWTELASVPTPRLGMATVAGPDGRIYTIGGSEGETYVTNVEAYTPATDQWGEVTPLPSPRAGGAATIGPDGRIYVIGGASGGGLAALASIVAYDPAAGAWSDGGGLPTARAGASAVTIYGRTYVVGGVPNVALAVLNTVIAYAPASGDWVAAGAIPSPFVSGFGPSHAGSPGVGLGRAVAPLHGPIYALATQYLPTSGVYSNTLVAYDPTTRQGVSGPSLPVPLIDPALAIDNHGRLYAIGVTADGRRAAMEMLAQPPVPPSGPRCRFVLGFATLHDALPELVGGCLDDEQHAANGDGLQHAANGLLVWRKADNFTAFTDGYRTWINGPLGIQERLNTQRFHWEANPGGLQDVP